MRSGLKSSCTRTGGKDLGLFEEIQFRIIDEIQSSSEALLW